MKNRNLLSFILGFSTLLTGTFLVSNNVQAETISKISVNKSEIWQNNLSKSPQPTSILDSDGNLRPLKLTFTKIKATPFVGSMQPTISTESIYTTASYTAPYSQITTPLGLAMFLQNGCTDADPRAGGWVSALQSDLNQLSRNYNLGFNLTVDGIYGSSTTSAIRTFQYYIRNSWGCSSMSIDGVAGYQTWTAIYALFSGYNPRLFIP
jgi:hypothetical protein